VKICIDPGHGQDPGAVGPTGLKEKDVVLEISLQLKAILERELGCIVVMTRKRDEFVSLHDRCVTARGCDLMVSIHCNGSTSNAQGMEVVTRTLIHLV